MKIKKKLQQELYGMESHTVLIHSDLMHGFNIPFTNRNAVLVSHMNELLTLKGEMNIWMPAFNYDFCKGHPFSVNKTPSQVGVLSEYFRKDIAHWRTPVPVFSFSGTGDKPFLNNSHTIDPFGKNSAFQHLYDKDALLMHYGSPIQTTTILHYAERKSDNLIYRYDKLFRGIVVPGNNKDIKVDFNFHVRPLGKHLDYNWEKIEKDLLINNILIKYEEGQTRILLLRIRSLIDFWIQNMVKDPLYFLDNISKSWIEPMLDNLGRAFKMTDFE